MIIERNAGKHSIILNAVTIGRDLLVTIYGGDEHHIGGVAVAHSARSHYRNATTVSVNTFTFPGHKDYIVANSAAEKICNSMGVPVVVTVGIHINNATREEIDEVVRTVDVMVEDLIAQYQKAE
jgi:riboflavin synthase